MTYSRNISSIAAALALTLLSSFAGAQSLNIQALNQKIQAERADWVAGETSVSHLSLEEAKSLMGLGLDPHPEVQFSTPEQNGNFASALADETKVDWRNRNGKNWVTPIKNQTTCGSCVAFASVANFETQYQISNNLPNSKIKLSPQFLFSCGGGNCKTGWWPDQAADFLKNKGTPDESCMPYRASDLACNKACSDAAKRSRRIAGYSTPTTGTRSLAAIKAALKNGPLVAVFSVYQDFMNYRGGIYKHVSGKYISGHAVSIVGYDDNRRILIVRNSWGTGWGEAGFVNFSYDDVSGLGAQTWKYTVASNSFALSSLNQAIDQLNAPETETVAPEYIGEEPQSTPALSLSETAKDTYLLQTNSAKAFDEIEFHQRHSSGLEKVVRVSNNDLEVVAKINRELLTAGEWEIFFVGKKSGKLTETEHFFIDVR